MRAEDKSDMLQQLQNIQKAVMNEQVSSLIIIGVNAEHVDELGKDVFTSHVISTQEDATYLCARMATLVTELNTPATQFASEK